MASNYSQGTSQSASQSTSGSFIPSYQEEPFLNQLAQYTGQLGSDVANWARGVWGNVQTLSNAAIDSYGNIASNAAQNGATFMDAANKGIGQYNNLVQDANTYNSEARQNFEAGRAEAAQTQAGDQALNAHKQDLASYGIDPSSGRYADLDQAGRLSTAAAAAGAGTQAIQNTAATGRQLRQDAIQAGTAYGNQAAQQQNIALQGVAGASNTNLATANTGVNLAGAANPYLQTGMSLKYPPLGNKSQSTSASNSQNSSAGYSGGGSGGGGSGSPRSSGGGGNGSPSGGGGSRSGGGSGGGNNPNNGGFGGSGGVPYDPGLGGSENGSGGVDTTTPGGFYYQGNANLGNGSDAGMGGGELGGTGGGGATSSEGGAMPGYGYSYTSGVGSQAPAPGTYGGSGGYAQGGLVRGYANGGQIGNFGGNTFNTQMSTPSWTGTVTFPSGGTTEGGQGTTGGSSGSNDGQQRQQIPPPQIAGSGDGIQQPRPPQQQPKPDQNAGTPQQSPDQWNVGGIPTGQGDRGPLTGTVAFRQPTNNSMPSASGESNYSQRAPANPYQNVGGGYGGGYSSASPNNFGNYSSGGGGYARGGPVHGQVRVPQAQRPVGGPFNFTRGGNVQPGMSPSHGHTVDDVRANLNTGEFVIPRDVVQHKGHEFFQKLISQARQNNMNYAAQQKMRGQR